MNEKEIQSNMNKSIEATQRSFNTIRTGRANASLLDRISLEYYDVETPLKSLASILLFIFDWISFSFMVYFKNELTDKRTYWFASNCF